MDAISLLYSKLLLEKLGLFVFGTTFAASPWQFVSICSCFVCDHCMPFVKCSWPRGRFVRLNEVAISKTIRSKVLLIRGLLYLFFHFIKLLFCRVLACL